MKIKEKLSLQIVIVVAFIAFIFAFVSAFPKVLDVAYAWALIFPGFVWIINIGAVHLVFLSLLTFFTYLVIISLFIHYQKNICTLYLK